VCRNHRFPAAGAIAIFLAATLAGATARAEASGAAAEGAEAGEHEGHAEPGLNWTDFANRHVPPIAALVINFAVLVGVLVYFGRKPLASFLAERRRVMEQEIDVAFEEKQRAQGRLRGVQLRAANLEEELQHLREDLMRVGFDERDRLVADAGARAEKLRREAEFQAQEERRRAGRELRARAVEVAVAAAETTLREKLTAMDHRKLADAAVKRLQEVAAK
jgi:F-type H+-transporting ATPase subunit b